MPTITYYWVKITAHSDWEPAVRIQAEDIDDWYATGSINRFTPAVIGPKLEAPK